jgi:cysteine desulfurase / selenocysteine lyase
MTIDKELLLRKEFSHLESLYFNSAYFGPSPKRAKQKVIKALDRELDPSFYDYNQWMGIPDRVRSKLAHFIGVDTSHIALLTSTTETNNIVAWGAKWLPGDTIVGIEGDYPSNILPWLLLTERRPDLHFVKMPMPIEFDVDLFIKQLPKQTRLVSVSQVTFDTGRSLPLIDLGRELKSRGIFLMVDGTQSLGGRPLYAEERALIDIYSCSTYKWMLGPYGSAFAYFSPTALDFIDHHKGNWVTSPKSKVVYNLLDYTTETLPGARKFDRGQSPNMLVNACLEAGLDFLDEYGQEDIYFQNQSNKKFFLDHFPKKKFDLITPSSSYGNILSIKAKDIDPVALERDLKFYNIDVSVRQGKIRLSFHVFNTLKQVETLIKVLDA